MKLDKMKFAKLVAHCVANGMSSGSFEVEHMDELCEVEAPEPSHVTTVDVNELLHCMITATDSGFIPAIRAYRVLTNAGLKESKEAIEKYRQSNNNNLMQKLKESDLAGEDYRTVEKFINNL